MSFFYLVTPYTSYRGAPTLVGLIPFEIVRLLQQKGCPFDVPFFTSLPWVSNFVKSPCSRWWTIVR